MTIFAYFQNFILDKILRREGVKKAYCAYVIYEWPLSLKPTSGIPAQCIKNYFVAVDNHVSFLNDGLQFYMNAENQGGHHVL